MGSHDGQMELGRCSLVVWRLGQVERRARGQRDSKTGGILEGYRAEVWVQRPNVKRIWLHILFVVVGWMKLKFEVWRCVVFAMVYVGDCGGR